MTTLKYFITSKAKRNLLKFFLTDINACYYTREASRLTGEPLNAVRRELGYLEKAGLLRSYMQGNLKYYEVIQSFPLLAEWRRIILETTDIHITSDDEKQPAKPSSVIAPLSPVIAAPSTVIASEAKQSVESEQSPAPHPRSILTLDYVTDHLREKFNAINAITLAVIHGEAALSEKIPEGGIELLIVGDINKDTLLELIADLEASTGIDINLMHLTSSGFDYRNAQGDPFIRRIWGEKKIVVKGRH
ncbi:MAG: hypothetical protein NTV42_07605 [Chloroflexi bacterium]|nr:hypothetical protein [Chloroflexota bacterium]